MKTLLRLPLFWKILVANAVVLAVVAVALARVEATLHDLHTLLLIGLPGLALIVGVNALLLRLALQPLSQLEQTADRVAAGDTAARVPDSPFADPAMRRLAATFNRMLDQQEEQRRRLRDIASTALGAQEEERRRIARELQDGLAQELTALAVRLRLARGTADPERRDVLMQELGAELSRRVDEVGAMAYALQPPGLDVLGLAAALEVLARQLAERTGIEVRTRLAPLAGALSPAVEIALYRIIQEALGNATRHADAALIQLELERRDGHVRALIADDGSGFDVADALRSRSPGLFGMQERAAYTGGSVQIESRPGAGTRVLVTIPVTD
jgi:two-component system sensor histidine kinase UhpB